MADPLPETSAIAADSAIENELSTYRAYHPASIAALACGVIASLSFVHWGFYIIAVLGILCGATAMRRINRDPEIYTGKGLARAGIALSLIFGLSAVSRTAADDFIRNREATKFGRYIAEVLANEPIDNAIWLRLTPNEREKTSPEQLMKQLNEPGPSGMTAFEQMAAPFMKIHYRLEDTDPHAVEFDQVIRTSTVGLNPVAGITFVFHPKGWASAHGHAHADADGHDHADSKADAKAADTKAADEKTEAPTAEEKFTSRRGLDHMTKVDDPVYAHMIIKADVVGGKYRWWIQEVAFPYEVGKTDVKLEADVDTHGHSH